MTEQLITREQAERWVHSTFSQTECEIKMAQTIVALYGHLEAVCAEFQQCVDANDTHGHWDALIAAQEVLK